MIVGVAAFFMLKGGIQEIPVPGGGRSTRLATALRYIPDDTNMLYRMDPESFFKSGMYESVIKNKILGAESLETVLDTKIALSDVTDLVGTVNFSNKSGIILIRSKRALTAANVEGFTEKEKVSSHTLLLNASGTIARCRIDDHTLLNGPVETVRQVLRRNADVTLSPEMADIIKEANFDCTLCGVVSQEVLLSISEMQSLDAVASDFMSIKGIAIEFEVQKNIMGRVSVSYFNAGNAKQAKDGLNDFFSELSDRKVAAALIDRVPQEQKRSVSQLY